jgi:hypothetical protein
MLENVSINKKQNNYKVLQWNVVKLTETKCQA